METMAAWNALNGKTPAEKLSSLGITDGRMIDIRMLDEIARTYDVSVILFFEDVLARMRSLESVQEEFGHFGEYERPYISVGNFLRFTRENDPSFEQTLREFPLMIEVVTVGEVRSAEECRTVPYITGLMPFLDELDIDSDPSR